MGTTASFLKLRSTGTPKVGEWNIDYSKTLASAKRYGKFLIGMWSNGDQCGYCTGMEKVLMEKTFTDWMKKSNCYFVFQYSGDKDKGKTLKDIIYAKGTGVKKYPGFVIVIYDAKNTDKIVFQAFTDGNTLRGGKTGSTGAKNVIANLEKYLAQTPAPQPEPGPEPTPQVQYKIRLNESLTTKKVNAILDAIDKNDGYCPCQAKASDTKCHCSDFLNNKKLGEPCICKIYVKQKK